MSLIQSCDWSESTETTVLDRRRASGQQAARRLGINAASLLAGDVLNRGVTFVIYALVARYCGAHSFGQLSLGLMLLYSFQVLSSVGLPTLIVREIAKQPNADAKYLINAGALVCAAFMVCYTLLGLFVIVSGYAADTRFIVLLIGLSILPWSLSLIVESVFRAHERMHSILWAAVPVNIAKLAVAYLFLDRGFGVEAIALVLLGAHTSVLAIQLLILMRTLHSPVSGLDKQFCGEMLRSTWNFFGISAIIALLASVNIVLLSWFTDESDVGVYSAAVQLLMPPTIALQAMVASLFPIMCRRAEHDREASRQLALVMFEALMFIAVPACALLWFCAPPLIAMIYHSDSFERSAFIVQIMVPSLVLTALSGLLGQLLMSNRREGINLRIVAADLVFSLACGTILISRFGVVGAAITLVLTGLLNCSLHFAASRYLLTESGVSLKCGSFRILWHTLISAAVMGAVMGMIDGSRLFWLAFTGIVTFILSFSALACLSRREMVAYRERFLTPLAER